MIYNEGILTTEKGNKDTLIQAMCTENIIESANDVGVVMKEDAVIIEIREDKCFGWIDHSLQNLCDQMKERNISLAIEVNFFGDDEGLYLKEINGEFQVLNREEKIIHEAASEDLMKELQRRGYRIGSVDEIVNKLNEKKEHFQKFYEKNGKTAEDASINKATQLAIDDAIAIVDDSCSGEE